MVWVHNINLTLPLFINVSVSSQEGVRMFICVLWVYIFLEVFPQCCIFYLLFILYMSAIYQLYCCYWTKREMKELRVKLTYETSGWIVSWDLIPSVGTEVRSHQWCYMLVLRSQRSSKINIFIKAPVPCQKRVPSCICALRYSILPLLTIFL